MRRLLQPLTFTLPLLALLTSACHVESALNPGDKVALTGSALNEDKTPLADATLRLQRSNDSSCILTAEWAQLSTDTKGAFTREMTGADTQSGDTARCFQLSLPTGSKGSVAAVDFLIQVTDVKVPALQRWSGGATATASADGVSIGWKDVSTTHDIKDATYVLDARIGINPLWIDSTAKSPVVLSDYVLEDFAGVKASVTTRPEVKGSGTTFHFTLQSEQVEVPVRAKVPASRGAACAYKDAPSACPLTDGKLDNVVVNSETLTVTLPTAKVIKKAVVRNLSVSGLSSVVLEGSADGTTFTKLTDVGTLGYQVLEVSNPSPFKVFRISGKRNDNGAFSVAGLSELSLFE